MFEKLYGLERHTRGNRIRTMIGSLIRKFVPNFVLFNYLAPRIGKIIKIEVLGKPFFVDLRDQSISHELFNSRIWEPIETKWIYRLLDEGKTFIDIGANIGYYTVLAAEIVGAKGKVIAFEPDSKNKKLLEKNVAINNFTNVTIEPYALTETSKTAILYQIPCLYGNHGMSQPPDNTLSHPTPHSQIEVKCVSLDEYFTTKSGKVDFIKMDIEGAEYSAIQGMKRVLKENDEVTILTEFWPQGLERMQSSGELLLQECRGLGFHIFEPHEDRLHKVSDEEILEKTKDGGSLNLFLARNNLTQIKLS